MTQRAVVLEFDKWTQVTTDTIAEFTYINSDIPARWLYSANPPVEPPTANDLKASEPMEAKEVHDRQSSAGATHYYVTPSQQVVYNDGQVNVGTVLEAV